MAKTWELIRAARDDLTDYVVHLTKCRPPKPARAVFAEILASGHIRPTFARIGSRRYPDVLNPTVKGPDPAVCLTEQTLAALVKTLPLINGRYSGFGVAYPKIHLHAMGGRPVLYGTPNEQLGKLLGVQEPGYEKGKHIYKGGLPPHLQYLHVRYFPESPGSSQAPVDFTWEREWRIKPNGPGLLILTPFDSFDPALGVLIVEEDSQVPDLQAFLKKLVYNGQQWPKRLKRIISLETAGRKLGNGDRRFGRIETWPFDELLPPSAIDA